MALCLPGSMAPGPANAHREAMFKKGQKVWCDEGASAATPGDFYVDCMGSWIIEPNGEWRAFKDMTDAEKELVSVPRRPLRDWGRAVRTAQGDVRARARRRRRPVSGGRSDRRWGREGYHTLRLPTPATYDLGR